MFTAPRKGGLYIFTAKHIPVNWKYNTESSDDRVNNVSTETGSDNNENKNSNSQLVSDTSTTKTSGDMNKVKDMLRQLHRLYGHLSYTTLSKIINEKCVDGIDNKILTKESLNRVLDDMIAMGV